jgi:hypothetical protein
MTTRTFCYVLGPGPKLVREECVTVRQELEDINNLLKEAYSRLGKFRKVLSMSKHYGSLKLIREHIYEGAEALEEFKEKHFKE